jgi:hypothetical protein
MDVSVFMLTCPVCKRRFQHGMHKYGRYLSRYRKTVCSSCYKYSPDGWAEGNDLALLADLAPSQIPKRNANGLLPRD